MQLLGILGNVLAKHPNQGRFNSYVGLAVETGADTDVHLKTVNWLVKNSRQYFAALLFLRSLGHGLSLRCHPLPREQRRTDLGLDSRGSGRIQRAAYWIPFVSLVLEVPLVLHVLLYLPHRKRAKSLPLYKEDG